ncbi:MBL fold metallo-hydrolase [Arthrobacter sp. NPDC080073]|uniref:MBL fold metallo-hydrolase n=1 Tax=Arthrobacter sp. NPDC080073 TaxID=3155919 RepID=UPI00343F0854
MPMRMIDLTEITIHSVSVSEMDNNSYLLTSKRSGEQVLIDAADDPTAIQIMIEAARGESRAGTRVVYVATTHSHWDHVRALREIVESTGARTAAGSEDAPAIDVPTDVLLEHGDTLNVEGFSLEVLHLRGHTPGSIAFLYRDPDGPAHLFTGDSLFPGGIGNTEKDPERFGMLFTDVVQRVFERLADDTLVHPGHGRSTTLGIERPDLAAWESRGW